MTEKLFMRGMFTLHLVTVFAFMVFAGFAGLNHSATAETISSFITWASGFGFLAAAICYIATLWSKNEEDLTAVSRTIAAASILGLCFSRLILPSEPTLDALMLFCVLAVGAAFLATIAIAQKFVSDLRAPGFFVRLSVVQIGVLLSWKMIHLPNGAEVTSEFLGYAIGLLLGTFAFVLAEGLAKLPRRIDITA